MTDQLPPYRHTAERLAQLEAEVQRLQSLEIAFNALEQLVEQLASDRDEIFAALERARIPRYPNDNVAKKGDFDF